MNKLALLAVGIGVYTAAWCAVELGVWNGGEGFRKLARWLGLS